MSNFEWAHATDPFAVHGPAELDRLADDGSPHPYEQTDDETNVDEEGCLVCTVCGDHAGNPLHEGPYEWGVSVSTGSNGVMLYGSPAELRSLLLRAHNALPPGPEYVPTGTDALRPRPGY